MKRKDRERGAAAVEAAFILPVLLLLVIGIMEFGFLFNQQISATNAAREGARNAAIHYADAGFPGSVNTAAVASAPTLSIAGTPTISYSSGSACGANVRVTVTVHVAPGPARGWLIGFFPFDAPPISGVGVMQCGG
ncbi:TadE/TadG family type IV pilus assembly protein [Arthrobacter glacialis]|uniref:Pilus assembly protein TadE n=1 Tax=Arthrobacter glacialis TaxID=1664 RepID=A0A2S4A001_ARTGL|nr:TadE family protein [Arthrobacter glacialis]POH74855.1 pilus assembly protein TadE [Arthrobacter glacialis]